MRKPRVCAGNVPEDGVLIARFDDIPCPFNGEKWMEQWALYRRANADRDGWINCKLVAENIVLAKANYWFGWSTRDKRFAAQRDCELLKTGRTLLFDEVHAALVSYKGDNVTQSAQAGGKDRNTTPLSKGDSVPILPAVPGLDDVSDLL